MLLKDVILGNNDSDDHMSQDRDRNCDLINNVFKDTQKPVDDKDEQ